jgi:predicted nucleic acid-binding Zn ribbon protein
VVQSMSDAPLATCAICGGRLRKVFSPIGIVFKGSGFYRTDSRSKPARTEPAADKRDKKPAAESTSTASSSDKAATKPKAAEKSA